MTVESQSAFARRLGKDRSHVTRLKQAGRLVLADGGKVDVEASLTRIEATASSAPQHQAVQTYWADKKTAMDLQREIEASLGGEKIEDLGIQTKRANLRKLLAEASKAEMEEALARGTAVKRAVIEKALLDAVAVILSAAENLPDRLAPQLTGIDDMERIRSRLKDEVTGFLALVSTELRRLSAGNEEVAGPNVQL